MTLRRALEQRAEPVSTEPPARQRPTTWRLIYDDYDKLAVGQQSTHVYMLDAGSVPPNAKPYQLEVSVRRGVMAHARAGGSIAAVGCRAEPLGAHWSEGSGVRLTVTLFRVRATPATRAGRSSPPASEGTP